MSSDVPVSVLVERAAAGDKTAWDALVDRYAGLVLAVCRRHRLRDADANDVSQTVWLRLVEALPSLREPEALPGWLVTTTRHECLRLERSARRHPTSALPPALEVPADPDTTEVDVDLLRAEREAALRVALTELPARCRLLLMLLTRDPAPSYTEVSRELDMPVGSIGPTRARCLDRLRQAPALAALMCDVDIGSASG